MTNWNEWSRDEQMIVYVLSILDDLIEKGMVTGGRWKVSDNCRGIHEEMKAAGIQPTQAEITQVMTMLQERAMPN